MHSHSIFMCKLRGIQSRLFQSCHTFPFYWNSKRKLYSCDEKRYRSNFNNESFLIALVALFQTGQIIRLTYSGEFNRISFLYINWILNVLNVVHNFMLIYRLDHYLGYINGTILLSDQIARK